MTHLSRLLALCAFAAASSSAPTARAQAPVVIERAPDSGQPSAEEIAALRAENRRLTQDLDSTRHAVERLTSDLSLATAAKSQHETALKDSTRELATLRAKLARLETAPPPVAQPDPAEQKKLADAQATVEVLASKNQQLESTLATRTGELRDAEAALATAEARATELTTAAAQKPAAPDLSAKLAETESRLNELQRAHALATAELTQLKTASAEHAHTAALVKTLRAEKAALETQLAEARQAAAAPAPAAPATTTDAPDATQVAELQDKLDAALRSYSLLQTENEQLKSGATDLTNLRQELQTARDEAAALQARLDTASSAALPPEVSDKIADLEDKLSTTLRSYSLLQVENDRLQASAAGAASAAEAAAAKSSSESATQMSALFDELRQTKAQLTTLVAENAQLKTRLAISGPPPGTLLSSPSRPGAALAPSPVAEPAATEPAPASSGRTHVVTAGDTLGKISRQYYGTPNRWEEILRANTDTVRNENALPIGATLRIP